MLENVRNRKEIETIRFLHNRFNECQEVKLSNKKLRLERDE